MPSADPPRRRLVSGTHFDVRVQRPESVAVRVFRSPSGPTQTSDPWPPAVTKGLEKRRETLTRPSVAMQRPFRIHRLSFPKYLFTTRSSRSPAPRSAATALP